MPIKTNLTDLTPAAQRFKLEITLPSGGFSNPTAFPGGKLTVFPWDVSTSEWMATAPKTNETLFMAQLTARLTHLKLETVKTMVTSELPLVAMVARALTFTDNRVEFTPTCPHCRTVQKLVSLAIPDQLQKVGEKPQGYTGDTLTLPQSKDVVLIKPITVDEDEAARNRPEKFQRMFGHAEAAVLASVRTIGGGTPDSPEELARWYKALAPADTEFLMAESGKLSPGVSNEVKNVCDNTSCGKEFFYELSLSTDFFRR